MLPKLTAQCKQSSQHNARRHEIQTVIAIGSDHARRTQHQPDDNAQRHRSGKHRHRAPEGTAMRAIRLHTSLPPALQPLPLPRDQQCLHFQKHKSNTDLYPVEPHFFHWRSSRNLLGHQYIVDLVVRVHIQSEGFVCSLLHGKQQLCLSFRCRLYHGKLFRGGTAVRHIVELAARA